MCSTRNKDLMDTASHADRIVLPDTGDFADPLQA